MSVENRNDTEWVHALTVDQLRAELERRGQSSEGTAPALRARLIKHENCTLLGWETPRTPTGVDLEEFEQPEGAPRRPNERDERSVAAEGAVEGDRSRLRVRPPRIEREGPVSARCDSAPTR